MSINPRSLALLVMVALATFAFIGPTPAGAQHDPLPAIRLLYLAAVESERGIGPALTAIEEARRDLSAPGSRLDVVLTGYQGAVVTLRAKHGVWPITRLRHLQEGLAVLDTVIAAHPDEAELRYLRLMSCYYLPGILGRDGSVRSDFAALAELLPSVADAYPRDLYQAIAGFVLDNGRLSSDQASRLRLTLSVGND